MRTPLARVPRPSVRGIARLGFTRASQWVGRWNGIAPAATAVDVMFFSDIVFGDQQGRQSGLGAIAVVGLGLVGGGVLLLRRRAPLPVLLILCTHSVVCSLLLTYRPVIMVCVALATLVSCSAPGRIAVGATAAVTTVGAWVLNESHTSPDPRPARVLVGIAFSYLLILLVAAGVGLWQRIGKRHRQEATRAAVAAERVRVARELHDVIAHCVSVMLLQAAGARRVLLSDPERAGRALANIEDTGTQAVEELRRLLGVLRAGDVEDGIELGPQQGLSDLEPLLGQVRAVGMRVRLLVDGGPGRLDSSVELAAYRMVQEALTNVTKHVGRGADVTVELQWGDDVLHLTVTDDGCGHVDSLPAKSSTGQGLLGLRERAVAVGGQLDVGPLPDGGFRVMATLPVANRHAAGRDGHLRLSREAPDRDLGEVSTGEGVTEHTGDTHGGSSPGGR